jgi:putative FmdB family regulatory protein
MPLYEFRCPSGHDFEKFYRSISAAPSEEKCPECGQVAVRLMSAAGLVFKGSGFYITDYGKDGKKPQTPPEGAKPKPAESGAAATASDSKPASGESKPASRESKPASGESKPSTPAKKSE